MKQLPGRGLSLRVTARVGLLALGLALLAHGSLAQDAKPSREREALRRSQAALQQAQGERDALRAEKDLAQKEKDAALLASQNVEGTLAATRKELAATRAELQRLRSEGATEGARQTQALASAEAKAVEREQGFSRQLAELRRERDELLKLNQRLVAMLEQRTEALADARRRNAALHQLGLEAVERFRNKRNIDRALHGDPIFGVSEVRIESTAEDLRMRIDAQHLAVP